MRSPLNNSEKIVENVCAASCELETEHLRNVLSCLKIVSTIGQMIEIVRSTEEVSVSEDIEVVSNLKSTRRE